MSSHDWSTVQVGDAVSKGAGYFTPGTPVKIVKRTTKHLVLENGAKIHTDHNQREYEPWSDKREAERAKRGLEREIGWQYSRFNILSSVGGKGGCVTLEDVTRDPALMADLAAAVLSFEAKRDAIIARAVAGRKEAQ